MPTEHPDMSSESSPIHLYELGMRAKPWAWAAAGNPAQWPCLFITFCHMVVASRYRYMTFEHSNPEQTRLSLVFENCTETVRSLCYEWIQGLLLMQFWKLSTLLKRSVHVRCSESGVCCCPLVFQINFIASGKVKVEKPGTWLKSLQLILQHLAFFPVDGGSLPLPARARSREDDQTVSGPGSGNGWDGPARGVRQWCWRRSVKWFAGTLLFPARCNRQAVY